jgi:serine/threonine-protein phosphatase PGAM5
MRRAPLPAVTTFLYQSHRNACDAEKQPEKLVEADLADTLKTDHAPKTTCVSGMRASEEAEFYGLFPKRQLWQPKVEYPLWDDNWDGRMPPSTGDNKAADRERMRQIRKTGVTRHVILIRHGQYDETYKEDEKRTLTELGKKQADLTGKRIAEMIRGAENESFGRPCHVKVLRVSDLLRAKETADIIAKHLPGVERAEPDALLNEGRPAHTIPGGTAKPAVVAMHDDHHPRIEEAFQKYFYRSSEDEESEDDDGDKKDKNLHEFEIIVGHANVIRYFLCR